MITILILIQALLRDRGCNMEKMEEEAEDERAEWQLWAMLHTNLEIIKEDTEDYPKDITAKDLVDDDEDLLKFLLSRGSIRETLEISCKITITTSGRGFDKTITINKDSNILEKLCANPDGKKIRNNVNHTDRTIRKILRNDVGIEDFKNKIIKEADGNETLKNKIIKEAINNLYKMLSENERNEIDINASIMRSIKEFVMGTTTSGSRDKFDQTFIDTLSTAAFPRDGHLTFSEVAHALGGNPKTMKKFNKLKSVVVKHFDTGTYGEDDDIDVAMEKMIEQIMEDKYLQVNAAEDIDIFNTVAGQDINPATYFCPMGIEEDEVINIFTQANGDFTDNPKCQHCNQELSQHTPQQTHRMTRSFKLLLN